MTVLLFCYQCKWRCIHHMDKYYISCSFSAFVIESLWNMRNLSPLSMPVENSCWGLRFFFYRCKSFCRLVHLSCKLLLQLVVEGGLISFFVALITRIFMDHCWSLDRLLPCLVMSFALCSVDSKEWRYICFSGKNLNQSLVFS